ncbi:hypothetical protein ACFXAZ_33355 [Streptomyces sp. NPDC059477]|uniref:hypothetical protein n=1 Tax=Streptomyces sp. NPDC059477 TaxID=3346847 RepID=UPI0036800940
MTITIQFIRGPADGRTLTIPDDEPPPLYLIAVTPPVTDLLADSLDVSLVEKAEYEPLLELGWPRRVDDGAFLYRHRPAPVTQDKRTALDQSRRASKEAEQWRTAETDAAWQEIREVRPDYPESWRDFP